eukprot:gene15671-11216_t
MEVYPQHIPSDASVSHQSVSTLGSSSLGTAPSRPGQLDRQLTPSQSNSSESLYYRGDQPNQRFVFATERSSSGNCLTAVPIQKTSQVDVVEAAASALYFDSYDHFMKNLRAQQDLMQRGALSVKDEDEVMRWT